MSRFSGKCDLYDHISMEKTYETPYGYDSDELECFNIFKEKTGGVIYQNLSFKLTKNNIENECKENVDLTRIKHTELIDGKKEKITYTYVYNGKEFKSLSDINKYGYNRHKKINFDTLLDIIPYYPYIISFAISDKNHEYIVISDKSYIDQSENETIEFGRTPESPKYYRTELQNHYKKVIKKYNL